MMFSRKLASKHLLTNIFSWQISGKLKRIVLSVQRNGTDDSSASQSQLQHNLSHNRGQVVISCFLVILLTFIMSELTR